MPLLSRLIAIALVLALSACAIPGGRYAPEDGTRAGRVVGAPEGLIRIWGDATPEEIARDKDEILAVVQRSLAKRKPGADGNFLALSGGGSNGAFGAGILNGWSQSGTRPEFNMVSGVSTGALIAPFAFLGSEYDDQLREVYTTIGTKDLLIPAIFAGLTGSPAFSSSKPFQKLVAKYVTMDVLNAVADAYEDGRFLLIGTTNLAVGRPVIWDMGGIASQRDEKALKLFREVMIASASIPVLFPPVLIDVEIDGEVTQEIHVDGGTTDNAILAPFGLNFEDIAPFGRTPRRETLYVILNGKSRGAWAELKPNTLGIAEASINTLLREQTRGDLLRLKDFSRSNRMNFRLTQIPQDFDAPQNELFDPVYMRALFDLGETMGREGVEWQKTIRGF